MSNIKSIFDDYLARKVNLDPQTTRLARESRDNLLSNIAELGRRDDFFNLDTSRILHFGSFARKTKCRELDDIDLLIVISANGSTYDAACSWDAISMTASTTNSCQQRCINNHGKLDSIRVLNEFKKRLSHLRDYCRSEIKRNQEAIVLNLTSKPWAFDIVPCFYTKAEFDGREYYLIPDGKGAWKKTDPRIDRSTIQEANNKFSGNLLELIRLFKRWNNVKLGHKIPSYLLETMLVRFANSHINAKQPIHHLFYDALPHLHHYIGSEVPDPKNIQGNINSLSPQSQAIIQNSIKRTFENVHNAIELEYRNNITGALELWHDVLGDGFHWR